MKNMLRLESLTKEILIKEHWQPFDLQMTPPEFEDLGHRLASWNQTSPQVYIHVCDEGIHRNQVLRIGKAEGGVYKRWITSTDGHKNTFFWAIGESDKYRQKNASAYPLYLLFFASLNHLKTKLYVLTCEDGYNGKIAARASEIALIGHFQPIWEQYKYPMKIDSAYPKLTGKNIDEEIHTSVTRLGGSLLAIENQRNGRSQFTKPVPDAINMGISSNKYAGLPD